MNNNLSFWRSGARVAFKPKDTFKTQDEKKPKYNLICIGSTRDAKNRIILSEEAQSEQSLATTVLNNAPMEAQIRIKQIAADKQKHKRMLTMSSKNFTFECQSQIKRKITIFDNSSCSDQDVSLIISHSTTMNLLIYPSMIQEPSQNKAHKTF